MYFSIKIRKLYESPHKAQHQINHIINIQNISALHTGMEGNFSRKIKQKAIFRYRDSNPGILRERQVC